MKVFLSGHLSVFHQVKLAGSWLIITTSPLLTSGLTLCGTITLDNNAGRSHYLRGQEFITKCLFKPEQTNQLEHSRDGRAPLVTDPPKGKILSRSQVASLKNIDFFRNTFT